MRPTKRWIFLFLLLCLGFWHNRCLSQSYPHWFLNPASETIIGYADASIYPDSAVSRAIYNGYENYARNKAINVKGEQAFWNTEFGMYWMGSNYSESFDSSHIRVARNRLVPLDTLSNKYFVAVLLADSNYVLTNNKHFPVQNLSEPPWCTELPRNNKYYFAVGLAPDFYYETSSWREAEKRARRHLARNIISKIQNLQKMAYGGQEIFNEEISAVLRNIKVVSRWRDLKEKIYYVLMRMPVY